MCGITGAFWKNNNLNSSYLINDSLNKLCRRGPNGNGTFERYGDFGKLILGHTRLSIIDLSDNGSQPMTSRDNRFTIIFNGEIYNYIEIKEQLIKLNFAFYTNSDTEVLLYSWICWGKSCLNLLNGMFSFVIYDSQKNILFCSRDGFGIKPFYYYSSNDSFFFASEIPAIFSYFNSHVKINENQVFDYITKGNYDNSNSTFFSGINQLSPGHLIIIDMNSFNINFEKWWEPKIEKTSNISFNDATEILRNMFLKNVKMNLRSDVPIGAALSGGIDSSAIVCCMRYLEPRLKIETFSYISDDVEFSEESWIDIVNNYTNAIPNKIKVNSFDLFNDIDDLVKTQCEPFGSTSIYAQYRVYKMAKEKGITVTLDGQGADELFAGYMGYPNSRLKSLIYNKNYLDAIKFIQNWSRWPGRSGFGATSIFLSALLNTNTKSFFKKFKNENRLSWINYNYIENNLIPNDNFSPNNYKDRELMADLRKDLTEGGLQALLRHGDRNSMRWSVESRVPFLNNEIAEFVLSLPENFLISDNGETKHLFRSAMRGIVPDIILNRKDKIGFKTPDKLLLNNFKIEVNNNLQYLREIPFINFELLFKSINTIENNSLIWRLYNLSKFIKHFN